MKKIKRLISFCLANIMILTCFSFSAFAGETTSSVNSVNILPSEVSPELSQFLEDLSIDTDEIKNMSVQFNSSLARSSSEESNVLIVTTKHNNELKQHIITGLVENEDGDLTDAKVVEQKATTRAATLTWSPGSTNVVQVVTALYAAYMNSGSLADLYYNPYGVQTYYYVSSGSYTVQNMYAQLYAKGEVFSYPSFTSQGYYTTHTITVNRNSPSANVTYSSTNYFSSNTSRLLRITNSGDLFFQVIVEMTVNGKAERRAYMVSAG